MQTNCSIFGLINTKNPYKDIKKLSDIGFNKLFLDLNVFFNNYEFENKDLNKIVYHYKQKVQDFIEKSCTLTSFNIALAPYLNINTKREDLNGFIFDLAVESIKLSAKAGCKYIIIKPLFSDIKNSDIWQVNLKYYLTLGEIAKQHNITILLQNGYKSFNGRLTRGFLSNKHDIINFLDELNAQNNCFNFCIDIGICTLCGQDINDFILSLSDRIKAIILRDTDRYNDSYLIPFSNAIHGTSLTDWTNIIKALKKIGYKNDFILDIRDTISSISFSLRNPILVYSKSIIDYIEWQMSIENKLKKSKSIVLFGAGNMCKNYMKVYGEKYKPLFTCDNNKNLWGTYVYGLEVKNPETLKDLDENAVIFICNMYYDEITEQFNEMGIKNKIERFSDEFLPMSYIE